MFPRLPRLLRVALIVLSLGISILFMLKAGGENPSADLPPFRRLPPHKLQGPLLTVMRHTATPKPRQQTMKVYRFNKTAAAEAAAKKATSPGPVNPHPFVYLINPRNACHTGKDSQVKTLIYVHSAPANFKKRMSVRQTWGERGMLQTYNSTLVFILGTVQEPTLMDLIKLESEAFGDVVQEDFVDSYRNLTYKAIAGLKWAATFCPAVTFILKTDDDILVNLPRVMHYIRTVVEPTMDVKRLILCNQWVRMKIIRDPKSKWYVPESDLKGDYFSPYCSGSAFILSGDMARLLYEASLRMPFFWVDDFYITGTLVQSINVQHKNINKAYSLNPSVAEGKFRNDTKHELFFFHVHKLRLMYYMWKNMTQLKEASQVTRSKSVLLAPPPAA